ncbi:hypothetical protein LJC45_03305 [Alistipes sp. OttesenSCG-928-B03]|nr:hypothetical protein [Alistipes sp. OttesenSCG-928-B03]
MSATGYLYPFTEKQLDSFNELYKDYDFKLKDNHIDVETILSNQVSFPDKYTIKLFEDNEIASSIEQLRMVARKGEDNIPGGIIDKMRQRHKKDEK